MGRLEARELDNGRAITEDDLVVDQFRKGDPLYDMPAAARHCKQQGLSMADMTEEDWKPFVFRYHE